MIKRIWFVLFFAGAACCISAQDGGFSLMAWPGASMPLGPLSSTGANPYTLGAGAELSGSWYPSFADFLRLGAVLGYDNAPTTGTEALSMLRLGAEVVFPVSLVGPLSAELSGSGGYNLGMYDGVTGSYPWAEGRFALMFKISPTLGLGLGASYREVFGLYRGVNVSLGVRVSPGAGVLPSKLELVSEDLEPIFPVFYKYYDENPAGTLTIVNNESADITDVKVVVFIRSFMDAPKTFSVSKKIAKNEKAVIPLYALFNQSILDVTEGTKASAEIEIRYKLGKQNVVFKHDTSMDVLYRNAMIWDDDKKVVSFITAKDPAVMGFAKNIAGAVRELDSTGFILQYRQALALFEAMSVHRMNYVVDPASSYQALSESDTTVDYLQFPAQSLTYRAGDCDDLTILYCALLEAAGIETAFITVPGHIFAAFSPGLSAASASRYFPSSSDYIALDGKAWIPVEITMLHDGFVRANQEGARQWKEALKKGKAALYPVRDAWETYEPTASVEDARVVPPSVDSVMARYSESWKSFVLLNIGAKEKNLKAVLSKGGGSSTRNSLGILYANYGLYDLAEEQFRLGAKDGNVSCLINLANIFFLQERWDEAYELYSQALKKNATSAYALLGIAKVEYERRNYAQASEAHGKLEAVSKEIAALCSYIVESTGDGARASSADERFQIIWGE